MESNIKTFSSNGKLYAIPEDKVGQFQKEMPDAIPVFAFEKDGKKLGIPTEKLNDFMKEVPDAKPLYGYPELSGMFQSSQPTPDKFTQKPDSTRTLQVPQQTFQEVEKPNIQPAEETQGFDGFGKEMGLRASRSANEFNRMLVNTPDYLNRLTANLINTSPLGQAVAGVGALLGKDWDLIRVGSLKPKQLNENLDRINDSLTSQIRSVNKNYEKDILQAANEGDWTTFTRNLAGGVADSFIPSLAMMITGGTMAPIGMVGSGAAVFGAGKLEELDKMAPDMDENMKMTVALSNGALEGIFETLLGSGAVGSAIKKLITKEGKEAATGVVKKGISQSFADLLTKYPSLAPLGEGFEEFGTQIAQNAVDKYSGYRPDIKLTDGSLQALMIGAASGGIHQAPLYLAKGIAAAQPTDSRIVEGQQPTIPNNPNVPHGGGVTPEIQALIDHERGIYEGLMNEEGNDQNKPMYQQRLDQITNDPQGYFTEALQRMEALNKNYPTKELQERINKLKGILSRVQPQAPADPMQQVRQQLENEFNAGVHKETGNNVWVNHPKLGPIRLSMADIDQAGNIVSETGEVFAWDPNSPGNQIPIPLTEIVGKPTIVSRDQFINDAMTKFQTSQAEEEKVKTNSFTDEGGQTWFVTGQADEKGNPIVSLVANGKPTAQMKSMPQEQLDALMQKKQVEETPVPEGEAKPVVETSTWGKTKYQHKSNPDGTTDVLIPNNIPASKAFDEISKHFATNSRYTVVPVKEKKVITDPNDKFADPREVEVTTGVKIVPKEMAPATPDQAQPEAKGAKTTAQPSQKPAQASYSFGKDKIDRDEAAEIINIAESYDDIKDLKLEGDQELQNLIQTKFPPSYTIAGQPATPTTVKANIRLGKNLDQISVQNDSELSNLLSEAQKKFTESVNKNQNKSGNVTQSKPVTPSQPTSPVIPGEQKSPINESVPEGQSEINGIDGQFVREDYPYLNDLEFEKLIDTANPEAAAPVLTKVNTVNAAAQRQHKTGVSVKDYIDNLYNEGYRLRGMQFISEGKNPIELSNNKIEKDYALLTESLQPNIETPMQEAILPQNPKEEREFGYKIDKGIRYDRKKPIDNKVEGNETNLEFSNNSSAPAGKWTVIEASEVQPSHVGKHRNPFHFIAEAQPKERTDAVSDVASEIIADKLSPEKITNKTTNAFYGAPTVNTRGEVIQGNNRSVSLQKYWNKYPSDPRGYKQYLIDHAQEMGLDPERIISMKTPVLVNMVDISDDQAISFGQYKESDLTTGGIQRISASETARKLKDKLGNFITMLTNSVDDTMSLRDTIASNALQALKYLHSIKAINDTQYQSALNKNIVTGDAIRDLQDIMTFSIFEGGRADLNDLFELLPYNLKIGIIKSTPNIMKEGGLKEEIQRMIIAHQYFVNSPWKDSGAKAVPAWSKNVDMLNPVTPEAEFGKVVVSLLHRLLSAKTQREVLLFFNEYDLLANGGQGLIPEPAIGRVKAIEKLLNVPENEQGRVFAKLRTDSNDTPSDGRGNELAPGQSPDKGSGTPIQGAGKENAAGKEPGEVTPPAQQPAKKADIERRRRKTIDDIYETTIKSLGDNIFLIANLETKDERGNVIHSQINTYEPSERNKLIDRINSIYDAELEKLREKEVEDAVQVEKAGKVPVKPAQEPAKPQVDREAEKINQNPSEAQKKAGNYQKGHVTIQGMDISIENPSGSKRSGTDKDGNKWERTMTAHYGYFKRTDGKDGDQIDTFINPDNPESDKVFVVDQNHVDSKDFDESKVMLGYKSYEEAKEAYLSNYEDGWVNNVRAITEVPLDQFKRWLYDGARQRKPFGEYKDTPAPVVEQKTPEIVTPIEAAIEYNDPTFKRAKEDFDRMMAGSKPEDIESAKTGLGISAAKFAHRFTTPYKNRELYDRIYNLFFNGIKDYKAPVVKENLTTEKEPWEMTRDEFISSWNVKEDKRQKGVLESLSKTPEELTNELEEKKAWLLSTIEKVKSKDKDAGRYEQQLVAVNQLIKIQSANKFSTSDELSNYLFNNREEYPEAFELHSDLLLFRGTGLDQIGSPLKDHYNIIEQAIHEGKPVPESVLKDYPELKKQETPRTNTIVPDVNNGKTINDIWIEWRDIKSEQDHAKWTDKAKNTKFGTYGSLPFIEVLNKFEPKFPNDILKRDFITEVETSQGYTPEQLTYKQEKQSVDEFLKEEPQKKSPKEYRYKMLLRPFDIGTHPKEGFVKADQDPEGGFQILTYDRKLNRKEWENFSFIPLTEINDVKGKQYEHQDGDYTIDLDWLKNNQWATVTIKDKNGEVMTDHYDMSYMDVLENIETGYWVESKPIEKVEPEIKTPLEDALDNSLAQKNEFVFDHVYRGWKYISSVGKYEAQVTYKNGESSKSTFTIYSSTPFPENQFPRSFKDRATLETYKRDLLYDETPAIPPADQEQKPPSPPKKPQKKSFTDQVKKGLSENDGNRLDELRNKLRNKLGGQLNAGLDPETFILAAEATGLVIKSGARQFKDFVASMVELLGNEIKPFLKGLYEYSRRADSSQFISEMTPTNDVDNSDIDVILKQLEDNSVDNNKEEEDVFDRPGDSKQDSPDAEDSPSDAGDIRGNRGGGRGGRGTNAKGGRKGNRKPKGGTGLFDLFPPDGTEQGDQDGDKGGPGDADPGGNGTDGTEGLDDVEGRDDDAGEGSEEVSESFKQRIERVRKEQRKAENIQAKLLDADNIRETLPFLLPEQQDDVIKAETRFFGEAHTKNKDLANGKGMLFTNGTGTGKTYTGLGIIKRFVKMGKGNVLIVVPSQPKVNDWIVDGRNLNLDITALDGIKDGGKGIVITTYANFSQNDELKKRDFDLVIYDESHRLMEEKNGTASARTYAHYEISNRFESDAYNRVRSQNDLWKRIVALRNEIYQRNKDLNANMDLPREEFVAQANEIKKLEEREEKLTEQFDENVKPGLKERAKEAYQNTKVVFLSATPFKSHFNLRYSNGILFDWGNNDGGKVSAESKFFLDNFGAAYEWKYNQLQIRSRSDADAVAMNEVEFSEKLMRQGVMSGRAIESPMDYERSFPLVSGFNSELFNRALSEIFDYSTNQFDSLRNVATTVFHNYNYSTQLFESLKASMSIDRMKDHLDMGRKVVVFHRRQQANVEPPFESILRSVKSTAENTLRDPEAYESEKEKAQRTLNQVALFTEKYSQLLEYEQTLDYRSAINQIKSEFGNRVAFVNGTVSTKEKNKAIQDFNKDDSGIDIIVVQEEAGKEGISLHDTTGNHQRVIMSLSMPNSSTTALQIEGRIYRIGNASDAIFEYPLLGLDMEINYFGQNINKRLSTTENLAIGNSARDLIRSFAEGVLFNSSTDVPSINQGKGGKEYDRAERSIQSDFQKAVLVYRSNQKTRGKRDQREGVDYFATPEPIGQKMVEWLDLRSGDAGLEPSAGHGAIAMWFPNNVALTAVEPSFSLFSRLNARAGGGTKRILNNTFESLDIVNKYNGIAMNPPFGTGGKTAMDHVEKAFLHLKNGGRLIAIVPAGPSMDKRVDKFFNEEDENGKLKRPEARLVATIELPGVTFEQAGTNVMSKILVIDRVDARTEFSFREEVQAESTSRVINERGAVLMTPSEIAAEARKRFEAYRNSFSSPRNINLSYIKGINELFEAIEGIGIDKRNIPESEPSVTPQRPASNQMAESSEMDVFEQNNTRTGEKLYMANFKEYVTRDGYDRANRIAKKYGGYFSKYENKAQKVRKGFLFKTEKDRTDFLNEYSEGKDFNPMQRVVSTIGYYSTVEDALEKISQVKGTPEQFKAMLLKNGAKQAEMDWMGWDDHFPDAGKKITKADIQQWIDQNKIEVQEVQKGVGERNERLIEDQRKADTAQSRLNEIRDELNTDYFFITGPNLTWHYKDSETGLYVPVPEKYYEEVETNHTIIAEFDEKWNDEDEMIRRDDTGTRYAGYTTPGGKNYRELLLTMPEKSQKPYLPKGYEVIEENGRFYVKNPDTGLKMPVDGKTKQEAIEEYYNEYIKNHVRYADNYNSGHWDEPNILAHIRFDERVTPDGDKVLFIQEIQSDWAQKGKKEGFDIPFNKKNSDSEPRFDGKYWYVHDKETGELKGSASYLTEDEAWRKIKTVHSLFKSRITPNMPFKNTEQWVNLSLRRMMRYAAEHGFDRIAWTTGEQQADRYDLSKSVESIEYGRHPNGGLWTTVYGEGRRSIWSSNNTNEKELEDVIGKDMTKKIIDNSGEPISTADSKLFIEATKPQSIRELSNNVFGSEMTMLMPLDHVDGGVLATSKHDQVRKSIISFLPIDVMNILDRTNISPDQLFKNDNVVTSRLPIESREKVAVGIVFAIRKTGALMRTELSNLGKTRGEIFVLPALKASDLNFREVAGIIGGGSLFHLDASFLTPEKTTSARSITESLPIESRNALGMEFSSAELANFLNIHNQLIKGYERSLQQRYNIPENYQLKGDNLKVSSPGMKAFYNKIIPSAASKLGKPFGAKVESIHISGSATYEELKRAGEQTGLTQEELDKLPTDERVKLVNSKLPTVQSIPVTETMKETAMNGLPLFSATGKETERVDSIDEVREAIVTLQRKAKNAKPLFLYKDDTERNKHLKSAGIPIDAAQRILKDGKTIGFYDEGRGVVFIDLRKIPSIREGIATWVHEMGVHAGLRNIIPGEYFESFMEDVYDLFEKNAKGYDEKSTDKSSRIAFDAWKTVNGSKSYKNSSKAKKGEEMIAYFGERYSQSVGRGDTALEDKNIFKQLVEKITNLLRKVFGLTKKELTLEDVELIVRGSIRSMFATGTRPVDAINQVPSEGRLRPDGKIEYEFTPLEKAISKAVDTKTSGMVEVDGVMRPTTNSEGRPIAPTLAGIRNFYKWFGESRVTDEQGRPLVVYHGTRSSVDFSEFLMSDAWGGTGAWFTGDAQTASSFASRTGDVGQRIIPAYLRIENSIEQDVYEGLESYPELRTTKAIDGGFDGMITDGIFANNYLVFSPTQIKSATGNNGNFDPDDFNIHRRITQEGEKQLSLFDEPKMLPDGEGKTYTTKKGEKIRYRSLSQDNWPVSGKIRGKKDYIPGDDDIFCAIERELTESKIVELTGTDKIESPADVAYLFRHLESAASENAFVVHHLKGGGYVVQYISSGSTSGTVVDSKLIVAAAKEFGSAAITFVHNHPSGNLEASDADKRMHAMVRKACEGVCEMYSSVIIDLDKGKYGVFEESWNVSEKTENDRKTASVKVPVYSFDKQVLYEKSDTWTQITGSDSVAKYLSKIKRGTGKYIVIIMNRNNMITRTFLSTTFPRKKEIIPMVGKYGESVIIASPIKESERVIALSESMRNTGVQLLDWIEIESDPGIIKSYKSFADEGLVRDPNTVYGYQPTEFEVNDPTPPIVTPFENVVQNAADRYSEDRSIKQTWDETRDQMIQFWKNIDLPIKRLQEEIIKLGGKLTDNSQPYRAIDLAKGRMESLYTRYMDKKYKPILKAISDIRKAGFNGEDILPYMIAKHTLERNPDLRQKEVNEMVDKFKKTNPDATQDEIDVFTYDAVESLKDKDYSGIMPFDKDESGNSINGFENPEELAQAIVDEYEARFDTPEKEALLKALWDANYEAGQETLEIWKKGNTLSEEEYEYQKARYKHFVPLRGWREGPANQLRYHKGGGFGKSLVHADGRTSLAENPLAYMKSVAFKALGEQVDNEVRREMLNLLLDNWKVPGVQKMVRQKTAYYIKVYDAFGNWEWDIYRDPESGELLKPDQSLIDEGEAKKKVYSQHEKLRTSAQAQEHEVWVRTEKMDVVLVFDSKDKNMLEVAHAFNHSNTTFRYMFSKNVGDADNWNKPLASTIGVLNNMQKAMYTSWNVVFPFTNFMRDLQEGALTQWIKGESGAKVIANYKRAFPTIWRSIHGHNNPEVNQDDDLYERFYLSGGITGYTHSKDIQQIEKEAEKEIKDLTNKGTLKNFIPRNLRHLKASVETWNRIFEDATRFSIFMAAVESGKTDKEAASMAKEATVNFNRKGKITKAFDSVWAFFNVALESAFKNFGLARNYPKRFMVTAGGFMASGFLITMLNDLLPGDDDDDYYNVSDYARRNYLIIPNIIKLIAKGEKGDKYLRVPLPQFWRGFYSMGSLIYDVANKKVKAKEAPGIGVSNFMAGLLPVDITGVFSNEGFSLSPIAPTITKPVVEMLENRNFMGQKIYNEPFTLALQDRMANAGQGKSNVNPFLKGITDLAFKVGGGETETYMRVKADGNGMERVSRIMDWNPSKIEHILKGYTGGTGGVFTDAITTLAQVADPNTPTDFRNIPFVNAFVRKVPEAKWGTIREYQQTKSYISDYPYILSAYKKDARLSGNTTRYREAYGNRFLQEYLQTIKVYDNIIELQAERVDYKTGEGMDEMVKTMKEAMKRIDKIKEKYDK